MIDMGLALIHLKLLLAAYYLFADCLLMSQVVYYQKSRIRHEDVIDEDDMSHNEHSLLVPKASVSEKTRSVTHIFFISSILLWLLLLVASAIYFHQSSLDSSKIHVIPQIFGWASAILYCSSRIPQILQNFKNQSVEGLSLTMFIFSVVGNLTFCLVKWGLYDFFFQLLLSRASFWFHWIPLFCL